MTLVELTVTIVLTGIVVSSVFVFVISTLRTYSSAAAKADLQAQAQTGVERISNDIMLSAVADNNNRIEDPNSPDIADPLGWVGDADTLILATAVEDGNRNLLFDDPAQYVTHKNNVIYYLDGDVVRRRVLANDIAGNRAVTTCPASVATSTCPPDTIVLESVETFAVTYYNHLNQTVQPNASRSVEVSVTLQSPAYDNAKVTYQTRTVFRND